MGWYNFFFSFEGCWHFSQLSVKSIHEQGLEFISFKVVLLFYMSTEEKIALRIWLYLYMKFECSCFKIGCEI